MKKGTGIISLVLLLMVFVEGVIGCSPAPNLPTETKPVQYGTLRIAMADLNEYMDPIQIESYFGFAMYDSLLTYDPQGNVIGELAESYSLSPDGKTWTFKIRPGITFHNGDPLTSADVNFSLDRFKSEESWNPWSHYLRYNFDFDETPDAYTYIYHTLRPEAQLVTPFTMLRILPRDYIEQNGIDYFRAHPVGTGPWKFVSLTPDLECVLEAVGEHWKRTPAFEKIIFYEVPEESNRVAMLKRGDIDILIGCSFDRASDFHSEGYTLKSFPLSNVLTISFQYTWATTGPMSDPRVRQALSYAINRQKLCDTYFNGFAQPGGRFMMDENSWGWDPSWTPDPYNPDWARALLAEAGYPEMFADPVIDINIDATWRGSSWIPDVMLILNDYWTDAGIQTRINNLESGVWMRMFFTRWVGEELTELIGDESEIAIDNIVPFAFSSMQFSVYPSANMYTSTGLHGTANDPRADELYSAVLQEIDLDKAKQLWTEFQNYTREMWVNVGIVKVYDQMVLSDQVDPNDWLELHISLYDALSSIQHHAYQNP